MFEDNEQEMQNQDEMYSYGRDETRSPELIKWQLSGSDLVDEIKHRLLGFAWSEQEEKWIEETDAQLNDVGINFVVATLIQIINKNTILSTLDEDMIFKMMIELDDTLTDNFSIYYKDFEIDITKLELVKDSICNQCYFAMSRALGGGEKKFLGTTEHRQYMYNQPLPGGNQKRKTFFGIPLPGAGSRQQ